MINLLPKETQNEIVVLLINKNKDKILELVSQMARDKEIALQITNLEAKI
jgi:flagellar motility protein MotE (MotC chaperone)